MRVVLVWSAEEEVERDGRLADTSFFVIYDYDHETEGYVKKEEGQTDASTPIPKRRVSCTLHWFVVRTLKHHGHPGCPLAPVTSSPI